MIIRQEDPKDYKAVYRVVKAAFGSAEHADGNEQDLVNALRKSKSFIPALSLVAEQDGKVTGHILFTEVKVGGTVQLALAPLSVLPAFQKQGIGKALIRAGHEKSRRIRLSVFHCAGQRTVLSPNGLSACGTIRHQAAL